LIEAAPRKLNIVDENWSGRRCNIRRWIGEDVGGVEDGF